MKPQISNIAAKFKRTVSPVREIMSYADLNYVRKLGLEPSDIISFAGGWVDHKSPESLKDAYRGIIDDDQRFHRSGGYPPAMGTTECRQAIADFERTIFGMDDLDVSQIAVGLGSTQLAMNLFLTLLDPGDKILLLDPSYCNYPTQIITTLAGVGILRFPVLDEETWTYTADEKMDELHDFILDNQPKAILLISPDNPTSRVLSDAFVNRVLDAAEETGSFLVIDFAYKEICFGGEYPEYFSKAPTDNFVTLHSNSKWCRGLGRRLGWIEAPEYVIEAMESIFYSTILCPDMMHQMAMTDYVNKAIEENTLEDYVRDSNRQYKIAAEHTAALIETKLGLPYVMPEGGLYVSIKVGSDGGKFVGDLLRKTGVLLVPGWGFGRTMRNAVRLSYGPLVRNLDTITKGIEKIAGFLNEEENIYYKKIAAGS